MIYFSKCKMPYLHDFEDYPCKKCNGIIIDRDFFERHIDEIVFYGLLLSIIVIALKVLL